MVSLTKDHLLEKYWGGETSIQEEQLLFELVEGKPQLFSPEEIKYFSSLIVNRELSLGTSFGKDLLDEFEESEKQESPTSIRLPLWRRSGMRVAASIVLLVGLLFGVQQSTKAKVLSDLTPEEIAAYHESKEALILIADKMNKIKSVTVALAKFDETHNKIKPTKKLK